MNIASSLLRRPHLSCHVAAHWKQARQTIPAVVLYSAQKQPDTPLTQGQKLKKAVAEYGGTVVVFHVGISLVSLGISYTAVSTGLDVQQLLQQLGLGHWTQSNTALVSNAGTFAVAYAIHKMFAPVRMAITLGSVPFIVRYLRRKGVLKK